MSNNDQKLEAALALVGLTGSRVTLAMVEEVLATVTYDTRVIPGTTCTQASAILPSGFVVAFGEAACADPANFNPALGIERAISKARDNAREQIWKLEGYRLSQALYEVRQGSASAALMQIRAVLNSRAEVEPGRTALLPVGFVQAKVAEAQGLAPHEVRVVHEKAELDQKLEALDRFMVTDTFWRLPRSERELLASQEVAMKTYSVVLGDRIAAYRQAAGSQDAGASK